jgi:hypothetical protein
MNSYQDFKNQPVSEKITLATIEASSRVLGFEVYSGSVYSLPFEASYALPTSLVELIARIRKGYRA